MSATRLPELYEYRQGGLLDHTREIVIGDLGDHGRDRLGDASPEAAAGGLIALVREGDPIEIDIPNRSIRLAVADDVLAQRRKAEEARGKAAYTPKARKRVVSAAALSPATRAATAPRNGHGIACAPTSRAAST
mgnify:CR=1 FL=1